MSFFIGVCLLLLMSGGTAATSQNRSQDQKLHRHLTRHELLTTFGENAADDPNVVPDYLTGKLVLSDLNKPGDKIVNAHFITELGELYEFTLGRNDKLLSPHALIINRAEVKHLPKDHYQSFNKSLDTDTLIHDPENHGHTQPLSSSCHYVGTVPSHNNATIALSLCHGMQRGMIVMDEHFLLLNPVPDRLIKLQKDKSQTHFIQKRSTSLLAGDIHPDETSFSLDGTADLYNPPDERVLFNETDLEESFCDTVFGDFEVPAAAQLDSPVIFQNQRDGPLTLEVALFLDEPLWKHFVSEYGQARAQKELTEFALALINHVHVLYQHFTMQPGVEIVIVRFEIWRQQPENLSPAIHKNGQAQRLLNAFCQYQNSINPRGDGNPTHWDHAILLTGFDIYHTTASVAGVAPVARMCDPVYSCALVEGMHLGRSFVLAHEMGHNLGMVHDGVQNLCSRQCCLMSPVNGAGKTTWSPCSVRELNAYVASLETHSGGSQNCLRDQHVNFGNNNRGVPNHATDRRSPGQRFTADQQCAFFWGSDYKMEIPAGRTQDTICSILWCGNGGPTISTAHPALEGTWCGGQNWCRGGQCVPWPVFGAGTPPPPVHGAWSAWATDRPTVCSQCMVQQGVRVRKEFRRCDHPAPNNGGAQCTGSNVRGIVCGRASDRRAHDCGRYSHRSYSDKLCHSFRFDPDNPDLDLDGTSYLHEHAPCKVWCQLKGSQLIRNKATYPDGTPCGGDKYCVNGECLSLDCASTALTFTPTADCPTASAASGAASRQIRQPQVAKWGDWSAWSQCSVTCGDGEGKRHRQRLCYRENEIASAEVSECISTSANGATDSDVAKCHAAGSPTCPGAWSSWSDWSECTVTCGEGGSRLRSRLCSTGFGCAGESLERTPCSKSSETPPCPGLWAQWGPWSVCSRSCGGGSMLRRRDCENGKRCKGHSEVFRECNDQSCFEWSPWAAWGACDVTCGKSGVRRRKRKCTKPDERRTYRINSSANLSQCPGSDHELGPCDFGTMPSRCDGSWLQWSGWSDCSVTCGSGAQRRRRKCAETAQYCVGPDSEDRACDFRSCGGAWSEWSDWSACSQTCGGGQQTRNRLCGALYCVGESSERRACGLHSCPVWTQWDPWSSCSSAQCGVPGAQKRMRSCRGNAQAVVIATVTGGNNNDLTFPSAQSASSDLASIEYSCDGNSVEEQVCKPENGCEQVDTDWTEWNECSHTCGLAGTRSRQRKCVVTQGSCPGLPSRTPLSQSEQCNTGVPCTTTTTTPTIAHTVWSTWHPWSQCDVTCGRGTRKRLRQCQSGVGCNSPGASVQHELEPCNMVACGPNTYSWSLWTSWSSCSRTCGAGFKSRTRLCGDNSNLDASLCGVGFAKEQTLCEHKEKCEEAVPVDNGSTGRGLLVVSRGSLVEKNDGRKERKEPISGGWTPWSSWSSCSTDCATLASGQQVRNRMCAQPVPANGGSYCTGTSFEQRVCPEPGNECDDSKKVDGGWSHWSEYGPCSATCGTGYRSRTRFCSSPPPSNGGSSCAGADFDIDTCIAGDPCDQSSSRLVNFGLGWSDWGSWSECSHSCGFGTQNRQRLCAVGSACRGLAFVTRFCALPKCEAPINGQWSAWGDWSDCPSGCDDKPKKIRIRVCSNPSPANGGYPCFGASHQQLSCKGKGANGDLPLPCARQSANEQLILQRHQLE